jgi:hypothetical protein
MVVILDAEALAYLASRSQSYAIIHWGISTGRLRALIPPGIRAKALGTPNVSARVRRAQLIRLMETIDPAEAIGAIETASVTLVSIPAHRSASKLMRFAKAVDCPVIGPAVLLERLGSATAAQEVTNTASSQHGPMPEDLEVQSVMTHGRRPRPGRRAVGKRPSLRDVADTSS